MSGPQVTASSMLPWNWQTVPATDPISEATTPGIHDTPDLTSLNGPVVSVGISGKPNTHPTFVSGLKSIQHHEGIMQTVSGFIPGDIYYIRFFQTVVKQWNTLDQSGSWAVYMDTSLIGISTPSVSYLAYDEDDLQWEERNLSFVATKVSHTIKFIPQDDDSNYNASTISIRDTLGALRMGIDDIHICYVPVALGSDTTLCEGQSLSFDVSVANAAYLWQDNSTEPTLNINEPGVYWVEVTTEHCSNTDSIVVSYNPQPSVDLGDDTLICETSTLLLDATSPNASYVWQDNSTSSTFPVTQDGDYWVEVTTAEGCSNSDTISAVYSQLSSLELGADTSVCNADFVELDATVPNGTYLWQDGSTLETFLASESGVYSVSVSEGTCFASDSIDVQFGCVPILEMPNVFTPDQDGFNEVFTPIEVEGIASMNTRIFNRWGQPVFETSNPLIEWKGDDIAASGVFFWVVDYEDIWGNSGSAQGTVTLLVD
ncbi:MAG: gliding motility-associated C-terminal domain-containing protein [Leptolyngbya sp. SIO3F4]|nr:gliding motility-associated C-terminal domain-containing protein [Leptolyngbya sp. SIO3F4]